MQERIQKLAERWLELDKNETTRAEIQKLLDEKNEAVLEDLLGSHIQFGTAGLRARMQAGFSRMNSVTVITASQGLASYILSTSPSQPSIVIGHDHRHNSASFARLTAAAMLQAGIRVFFYPGQVHTPLVPFAVTKLGASAGVMITASHNPKMDNGYKVYWGNGCQIVPPHDSGIAGEIAKPENQVPRCWDESLVEKQGEDVVMLGEEVQDAYFAAVARLVGRVELKEKFIYTPMHGVGLPAMRRVAKDAGVEELMVVVAEQAQPDPEFPTVPFPNPEEKGALDLAIAKAKEHGIRYILASDPDADRFAFAFVENGASTILSGNDLGILFAEHMHKLYPGKPMLTSTVSSQQLAAFAAAEGFGFEETLTGFKWLGSRGKEIGACYAFEEAIGYMFADVCHDKDGITAAGVFLSLLASTTPEPLKKLEELEQRYGCFARSNGYYVSPFPAVTKKAFEEIRARGEPWPQTVGRRKVTWWRDLTEGVDSKEEGLKPRLPVSKSSEMVTVGLEEGVRFTVRGSGTEPKVKVYVECKADSREKAERIVQEVRDDLEKEWFRPSETGLKGN